MTLRHPLVSVVIPAFNAERYLGQAIQSVLQQSLEPLECIVVNDGSTDGTEAVVSSFNDPRLRCLWKENGGTVSNARNVGIQAAQGTFVAFLDADDVWLKDKLARQMELFERDRCLGFTYCAYAITDSELNVQTVIRPERRSDLFLRILLMEANGIAAGSTLLARRQAIESVGGFREDLSMSADAEWGYRLSLRWKSAGLEEPLVLYRSHPHQGHRSNAGFEAEVIRMLDGQLASDPQRRSLLPRGMANLHTRLFFYELKRLQCREAFTHLRKAMGEDGSRVLALPAEALIRRAHRRFTDRRSRPHIQPMG